MLRHLFDVPILLTPNAICKIKWENAKEYVLENIIDVLQKVFLQNRCQAGINFEYHVEPNRISKDDHLITKSFKLTIKKDFHKNPNELQQYYTNIYQISESLFESLEITLLENYLWRCYVNHEATHMTLFHSLTSKTFGVLNRVDYDISKFIKDIAKVPLDRTIWVSNLHGQEMLNVWECPVLRACVQRGSLVRVTSPVFSTKSFFGNLMSVWSLREEPSKSKLFNYSKNRAEAISFLDCLKHCFRFNTTENEAMGELNAYHENVNIKNDIFKFNNGKSVAKVWIHVEDRFLDETCIRKVVATFFHAYGRHFGHFKNYDETKIIQLCNKIFVYRMNCSELNESSTQKHLDVVSKLENHEKLVALHFLYSEICLQNIENMLREFIFIPFEFMVLRPWEEFDTNSMLVFKDDRIENHISFFEKYSIVAREDVDMVSLKFSFKMSAEAHMANRSPKLYLDYEYFLRGGANNEFINNHDKLIIQKHGGLFRSDRSLVACLVPVIHNQQDYPKIIHMHCRTWDSSEFYNELFQFSGGYDRANQFGQTQILKPNTICVTRET